MTSPARGSIAAPRSEPAALQSDFPPRYTRTSEKPSVSSRHAGSRGHVSQEPAARDDHGAARVELRRGAALQLLQRNAAGAGDALGFPLVEGEHLDELHIGGNELPDFGASIHFGTQGSFPFPGPGTVDPTVAFGPKWEQPRR